MIGDNLAICERQSEIFTSDMATDIQTIEKRYVGSCHQQGTQPNKSILLALFKAKVKKSHHEVCNLVIYMDDVKDVDFNPLVRLFLEIDDSEISGVDILQRSSCFMSVENVLFLLHIIRQKLRVVDLLDMSFGKKFLLDISRRGLTCQVLNLRSSHFRKLNMIGNFMQMHTLNLDFSTSLFSFQESCFNCMPNLRCLSLCETRVSNLWTTSAALSKLTSLIELRFQNSLCVDDVAGSCQGSSGGDAEYSIRSGPLDNVLHLGPTPVGETMDHYFNADGDVDLFPIDTSDFQRELHTTLENASDESEEEFSGWDEHFSLFNLLTDALPWWNEMIDPQSRGTSFGSWEMQIDEDYSTMSSSSKNISYIAPTKYISTHPSPICFEKHYREYMIASLPNLRILDNLPIRKIDKDNANIIFSENFECLPYKRKNNESLVSILQSREMTASGNFKGRYTSRPFYASGKSQFLYSRSLCAAKLGSSAWPFLRPLSISASVSVDDRRKFRPRQFEYHPSNSSLMVFGTLDGEVVAVNHESENIVSYIPSFGAMNSVLGLSWLKKYPSKLIAGSENGSLKLYDIQHTPSKTTGIYHNVSSVSYDEFDQLTSVHVNSTDELFLASGYSKDVALYDISSGKRIQVFTDMHRQHINVVKFANHSPSLFATSSFDKDIKMWDLRQPMQPCYTTSSCRGNVMVCFSPDDHYLLASAIDNEVKQFLAVDGRLHLDFGIASTGSTQNYTRSYYMNGRDYIISGSCDENVVRICCAQTGRRLRDITLNGKGSRTLMLVQSLRSDPYRDFNMSILAAYSRPGSNSEILKVNLLASNDYDKEYLCKENHSQFCSMGG